MNFKNRMKQKPLMLMSLMVLLMPFSTFSQQLERYNVNKIDTGINVDGYLNEDVWTSAEPTRNFVILGNNSNPAKTVGWAKMLWDDTYLYVAFYCEDSKIWANYLDRDDPLYKEDVVEVYIDANGDGERYLEIEVSPLNTIFDLWLTKPRSSGGQGVFGWTMEGLQTAISVDGSISDNYDIDNSWICEMAMPFSEMEFADDDMNYPPHESEFWRFNLYRFDRSSTDDPNGEPTGWNQTSGGQHEPSRFGAITFVGLPTDVEQFGIATNTLTELSLKQNFPNPFNPITNISYSLAESGFVKLKVYDQLGNEVASLVNEEQPQGNYKIEFNAESLASGVYIYKLEHNNHIITKKLTLLK